MNCSYLLTNNTNNNNNDNGTEQRIRPKSGFYRTV